MPFETPENTDVQLPDDLSRRDIAKFMFIAVCTGRGIGVLLGKKPQVETSVNFDQLKSQLQELGFQLDVKQPQESRIRIEVTLASTASQAELMQLVENLRQIETLRIANGGIQEFPTIFFDNLSEAHAHNFPIILENAMLENNTTELEKLYGRIGVFALALEKRRRAEGAQANNIIMIRPQLPTEERHKDPIEIHIRYEMAQTEKAVRYDSQTSIARLTIGAASTPKIAQKVQ